VKTLVRKKLRLIPQKSYNNARDFIQYNKYIHSIGHWNNQSIVPIDSWKSHHVRGVVLSKRCVATHPKNSQQLQTHFNLRRLQTHFNTKREKGVGTPFPRVPAPLHPEPCTLACRRSTFYQHSQFLKRLLEFWYNEKRKHEKKKFEHKLSQKLQFWHLLHIIMDG